MRRSSNLLLPKKDVSLLLCRQVRQQQFAVWQEECEGDEYMDNKKYRILLVTGIVTDEHDPKVNGMLRRVLESTGRFEVKITEEFRGATAETLEGYDAVLLNYDGKKDVTIPYVGLGETAERTICDFVAAGGGIIIYHSSMIMGEPALPEEYSRMIGGTFRFDNGGRKNPKLAFSVDTVFGDPGLLDYSPGRPVCEHEVAGRLPGGSAGYGIRRD